MKTKEEILKYIFDNDLMGILNEDDKVIGIKERRNITKTKDKLYMLRQTIDELIEVGPDYAHFMNAQITNKSLKKIKKLLEYIG